MDAQVHSHADAHGAHAHSPHLQHHFDSLEQQFDSGKLGMWLFLATEVLLFAGLFCAYSVYRANHPEIFIYAHQFLDKFWGAVNTGILIASSLTMAWAVRCSQIGKQTGLVICLCLTLLGGVGFLCVKYVEYKAKWEHGLLWASQYNPSHHGEGHDEAAAGDGHEDHSEAPDPSAAHAATPPVEAAAADPAAVTPTVIMTTSAGVVVERSKILPAAMGPMELAPDTTGHDLHGKEPQNVQTFFSIYFMMTGLHGVHVIIGMLAIAWVLIRSLKGHFSPAYFTPVDLVGLYWHLVDLIWIYLFPLLYLIH
ncbi:MAG: cytochrome c oxidase subunit 3 [Candidatus Omnitrophica bacterium]|nr:cytochrome c oxidase subunit 3 [Candidatus Omnitrophota bacterium]